MIKLPDRSTIYVDVDDTLILWRETSVPPKEVDNTLILVEDATGKIGVWPHKRHVELVKQLHASGHTIVVWSQGGSDWAEAVVTTLGLKEHVHIVMPKPYWFIDDISAKHFMEESRRIWLDPKAKRNKEVLPLLNAQLGNNVLQAMTQKKPNRVKNGK